MANINLGQDIQMKEEYVEEVQMETVIKSENIYSNPWLIENAELFLKYCCPECEYSSKDVNDFSRHMSENHISTNIETLVKEYTDYDKTSTISLEKSEWGNCVVPNCTTINSFGFFKLPKQQEKHDLWLQLCGLKAGKKDDRICADHFMSSDFCLKPNAYPSLNLNSESMKDYLMTETTHQRKGRNILIYY